MEQAPQPRLYRSRIKGQPLLVCGKCLRKQKHHAKPLKLKKQLKALAFADYAPHPLHILKVPCFKLCPKDGVAVCPPAELLELHPRLQILRTPDDVAQLYRAAHPRAPVQPSRT